MRRAGRTTLLPLTLAVALMTGWLPASGRMQGEGSGRAAWGSVAGAAEPARGPGVGAAAGLAPDPAMQEEISSLVKALNAAREDGARRQAVEDLQTLAGAEPGRRIHFLEQLEIFLADAVGTEQAMGGAVLLHALEFDREEIMTATLPHLVDAGPALHKVLGEVAATAIEPDREDDPIALVLEAEHLRLEEDGAAAAGERAGALRSLLRRLAQDDSPWVRGYAARASAWSDARLGEG